MLHCVHAGWSGVTKNCEVHFDDNSVADKFFKMVFDDPYVILEKLLLPQRLCQKNGDSGRAMLVADNMQQFRVDVSPFLTSRCALYSLVFP